MRYNALKSEKYRCSSRFWLNSSDLTRWELELETVLEDRFMGGVVTGSLLCAAAKEGETVLNVSMSFFNFNLKTYLVFKFCFVYNPVVFPLPGHPVTVPHSIPPPLSPRGCPHPTAPTPIRHPHSLRPQFSQGLGAISH